MEFYVSSVSGVSGVGGAVKASVMLHFEPGKSKGASDCIHGDGWLACFALWPESPLILTRWRASF